ncbi:hypothetical protein AVEN_237582-1 [Araneus ventricosus]|uniref:Uncharacterized protein n=1 Tax=Araneus ventricosus TaxID=182803 RepID=A0A4Y2SY16_ARAVE|nr:hypothetical protein AVEN_237582-1 [Araneus ventricosus]
MKPFDFMYGRKQETVDEKEENVMLMVESEDEDFGSFQQKMEAAGMAEQQVIGYCGCVEWPPRSPDQNALDFFLWGYIKQRVYATTPPTLQELRNRITDACASASPAMLYNVQREVQSCVQIAVLLKDTILNMTGR